jgi:3-oxoacyl-[acyl-carrier protein] reductase
VFQQFPSQNHNNKYKVYMENRVVLVTGGSRGIGREICLKFAHLGYDIAFCYRSNDLKAAEVENEIKSLKRKCKKYKCDVRNLEEVQQMTKDVFENFKSINVLVNNAGILKVGSFAGMQKKDWNDMFETNLYGVLNCSKASLGYLMKQKGNSIINISSFMAIRPAGPAQAIYASSKAAIIGFTRSLSKELSSAGIRVNVVAPGMIDTDMISNIGEETLKSILGTTIAKRLGKPQEIAELVAYLASEGANYINGQTIAMDGGGITYQF